MYTPLWLRSPLGEEGQNYHASKDYHKLFFK